MAPRSFPVALLVLAACSSVAAPTSGPLDSPRAAASEDAATPLPTHAPPADAGDARDATPPPTDAVFTPRRAPFGFFGGRHCAPTRAPVVFLHGNGDSAVAWTRTAPSGGPSPVDAFLAAGYGPCDLFGLTWLSPSERAAPQGNFHTSERARLVLDFLDDVRAFTRRDQVDVVAHSMGVTVALHGLTLAAAWPSVRRFVAIAGAMRGLASCVAVGPANPAAPTCGAQNLRDGETFGFYPTANPRMEAGGFRATPQAHLSTQFYAIRAGDHDEVLCARGAGCESSRFEPGANVMAQIDVGAGAPVVAGDDDSEGIGHFRARSETGALQVAMLAGSCRDAACCASIVGACRP